MCCRRYCYVLFDPILHTTPRRSRPSPSLPEGHCNQTGYLPLLLAILYHQRPYFLLARGGQTNKVHCLSRLENRHSFTPSLRRNGIFLTVSPLRIPIQTIHRVRETIRTLQISVKFHVRPFHFQRTRT